MTRDDWMTFALIIGFYASLVAAFGRSAFLGDIPMLFISAAVAAWTTTALAPLFEADIARMKRER